MSNIELDREKLREYVSELERCFGEKEDLAGQIVILFSDAKADGFDVKALRQLIRDRKMQKDQKKSFDDLVDKYKQALDME